MSLARKQAITLCSTWFVIFAVFAAVFFSSGVESFTDQGHRGIRVVVALVILPGYILNIVVMQRSRRALSRGELDERDEAIANKASEVTLIILAVLIFGSCIGLYEVFREAGVVPVGWLYFLAYGTMSLIGLAHSAVTLVLDFGGKVDG